MDLSKITPDTYNLISAIFTGLITLICSVISIVIVFNDKYKSPIGRSFLMYETNKIDNLITEFWNFIKLCTIIFPIALLIIRVSLKLSDEEQIIITIISSVYVLLLGAFSIYYYLKIAKRERHKIINYKNLNFFQIYIMPVIFLIVIILLFIFTCILVFGSKHLLSITSSYLSIYIFNILLAFLIYFFFIIIATKNVKEIRLFYNENGKTRVDFEIKLKDLYIDKHYVKFYLHKRGYKKVIQSKDLIRIEYHYYE